MRRVCVVGVACGSGAVVWGGGSFGGSWFTPILFSLLAAVRAPSSPLPVYKSRWRNCRLRDEQERAARPRLVIVHSYLFIRPTSRLPPQWPAGFLLKKRSTESVSSQMSRRVFCWWKARRVNSQQPNSLQGEGGGTLKLGNTSYWRLCCCWYLSGVNTAAQPGFTNFYSAAGNSIFSLLVVPGTLDSWLW